jgi:hypothetical protein
MARGQDSPKPEEQDPPVKVTLDTSEVPSLAPWGERAKRLVEEWYPIIADLLKSDGFTPPAEVKLVFEKDEKGIAGTSGATITIASGWVERHPDDFGMVIHELTHVIQSYPHYEDEAGWVVEGIADYVRYIRYEPKAELSPIDPKTASYRDGYGTAARFLAWIEKTYDKQIVARLNRALRGSKYAPEIFREATSKGLDELWGEFVQAKQGRSG